MGLDNGKYCGWNLTNNTLDHIEAHNQGVSAIIRRDQSLISGHLDGQVQFRNIPNQCKIMIQGLSSKTQKIVTCLEIMSTNNFHFILVGDAEGGLTLIRIEGVQSSSYYKGIYNDKK